MHLHTVYSVHLASRITHCADLTVKCNSQTHIQSKWKAEHIMVAIWQTKTEQCNGQNAVKCPTVKLRTYGLLKKMYCYAL